MAKAPPSPPPEAEILKNSSLKRTTKIPDLASIGSGSDENLPSPNSEGSEKTVAAQEKSRYKAFDKDALDTAWQSFASIRRKEGKAQEQHIFAQPHHLDTDGRTITIELNNSIQVDILEEIRSDFIQYLRNSLENDSIRFEVKLLKENGKKLLYTNKEKLDHLAKKNPFVKELQAKLGLDPDF